MKARSAFLLLSLICACPSGLARAGHPNIVFILADDMGYGDVRALNEESRIPTPNLDRLAAEGMTFTDAHTPSSVCTPTRYGLLTGRYCWRSRLKRGVLGGFSPPLIEPDRVTVAGFLKARGYHTGMVGKWHLGMDWARAEGRKGEKVEYTRPVSGGPGSRGFDFSYWIPASLDMPPYVYVKNDRVVEEPTASQARQGFPAYIRKGVRSPGFRPADTLDHLLGQAAGYIRRRAAAAKGDPGKARPFFLYFALTAPHKPVLPHPRFRGKTDLGPYGDFVVQVDWTVGEVLRVLKETGLEENTLLFFSSDNGSFMFRLDGEDARDHVDDPTIQAYRADRHRANYRFRGTKADIWEGGHRVPFFARCPGRIRAGSRCSRTICLTDLLATCAGITGEKLPGGAGEDSFSLLPLLEGKPLLRPRPPVIHHSIGGMFSIREGTWKLILGNGSGGREKPGGKPFARPYQLYDLSGDIGERRNLAGERPETVRRLEELFQPIRGE